MRGVIRRAILLIALVPLGALAQVDDPRYCGPPKRDASGEIVRSSTVLRAFERLNPRPMFTINGERWIRDHMRPLASCGCDSVINLQWLNESAWRAKSLWERKAYVCRPEDMTQ